MTEYGKNLPPSLSVCLDLSPSHGGLYRAVVDLAQAIGSPILSFKDGTGALHPGNLSVPIGVVDMVATSAWQRFVRLPPTAGKAAEKAAGNPHIIFCHSLFRSHDDWVRRLCRRRGIPYVAVPHGSLDPWVFLTRRAGKAAWMAAYGRRYFRDAAMVMFSTTAERLKAQQTLGFAPKSCVLPWPVAARTSPASTLERQAARLRLALPGDRRILIYLGRYHSMKRPLETARTFLQAAVPAATLVMAGFDGDVTAEQLRRLAPAERDRIRILGPLLHGRRDDLFLAADAFVSWSHRENFCYAAAEAMGFGLPVILSPGNDLRSELDDTPCGWCLQDDTPASFGRALHEFGAMPAERLVAMGESGRRFVQRECSREVFADATRALVSTLTSDRPTQPDLVE